MIWRSWVGRSSDEYGRVTWCLKAQLMKDVIDWSNLSPIVIRATRVLSLLHPSIHPSTDNICQQHPHRIHCWIREAAIEKYDKLLWLVGAFAFGAEVGSWKRLYEYWNWRRFELENVIKYQHFLSSMVFMYITDSMWSALRPPCPSIFTYFARSDTGVLSEREALKGFKDSSWGMEWCNPLWGRSYLQIKPKATTGPFSFEALQVSPGKTKGIKDFEEMLRQTSHSLYLCHVWPKLKYSNMPFVE